MDKINTNSKTNIMITSAVVGTGLFKNTFLLIYSVNLIGFIPQVENEGFYEALVSNIPVQVLSALGIVAGIIWVSKLADNAWTNHKLNKSISKIKYEKAKQEQIETDILKQKLEKDETAN